MNLCSQSLAGEEPCEHHGVSRPRLFADVPTQPEVDHAGRGGERVAHQLRVRAVEPGGEKTSLAQVFSDEGSSHALGPAPEPDIPGRHRPEHLVGAQPPELDRVGDAFALVALSALSFLGLVVGPGEPNWGRQLSDGRNLLADNPAAVIAPGLLINLTATAINLTADWIQERYNARTERSG